MGERVRIVEERGKNNAATERAGGQQEQADKQGESGGEGGGRRQPLRLRPLGMMPGLCSWQHSESPNWG